MGNEKKSKKNSNKIFALITYVIAFVCLLLGLFLPYNFADPVNSMIGLQLPAAFDAVYTFGNGMQALFNTPALDASLSFTLTVAELNIDLGAVLLVLYGVVVVAGLIALIPVIASACASKKKSKNYATEVVKKHSNVALEAASFIEVLAILVLSVYSLLHLSTLTEAGILAFNYAVLAAFGGTLLMLVVQAFFYKGGSGFIKFILALLSALVVILLYGVNFIIPPLEGILKDIDLSSLFTGAGANPDVFQLMAGTITGAAFNFENKEVTAIILEIGVLVFGWFAFINFVLDLMGLGKRTNKFMLVVNVIRYGIEFIAAALVVAMTFFIEGITLGYLAIAVLALATVSLIINIFRLVASPKKKTAAAKKGEKAQPAEANAKDDKKTTKQPKTEKATKETKESAPAEVKKDGKAAEQKLYTPVIYNGPSDDFIKTLANEQKVEFSRVFLERQNGALPQIPEYVVGGKNDKFFSSLFIYYTKVRDLISDELMNACYKQANVM